jgi:hypothetical protein
MNRIPCFVLCFFDFPAIEKSLNFFSKFNDKLELVIVENPSKYTDTIKPFILNLLKEGKIDYYYLMNENIGLNAIEMLLKKNTIDWMNKPYIINAEGDLASNSMTWIEEEKNVLDKYPNVLACGMGVDLESFKKIDPRGAYWYPAPHADRGDYYWGLTGGGHAVMWRNKDMIDFLQYMDSVKGKYVDNYMHPFVEAVKRKEWGRTKYSLMEHYSWNYQLIDNHEYHEIKKTIPWVELFHHDRYCEYTLFQKGGLYD